PPAAAGDANVEALRRVLRDWRRSGLSATGPLRTCFRLVPPPATEPGTDGRHAGADDDDEPDATPWRVEILLQSTNDPSLLVAAGDVWHDGPAFEAFRPLVPDPGGHLRTDLG